MVQFLKFRFSCWAGTRCRLTPPVVVGLNYKLKIVREFLLNTKINFYIDYAFHGGRNQIELVDNLKNRLWGLRTYQRLRNQLSQKLKF